MSNGAILRSWVPSAPLEKRRTSERVQEIERSRSNQRKTSAKRGAIVVLGVTCTTKMIQWTKPDLIYQTYPGYLFIVFCYFLSPLLNPPKKYRHTTLPKLTIVVHKMFHKIPLLSRPHSIIHTHIRLVVQRTFVDHTDLCPVHQHTRATRVVRTYPMICVKVKSVNQNVSGKK